MFNQVLVTADYFYEPKMCLEGKFNDSLKQLFRMMSLNLIASSLSSTFSKVLTKLRDIMYLKISLKRNSLYFEENIRHYILMNANFGS